MLSQAHFNHALLKLHLTLNELLSECSDKQADSALSSLRLALNRHQEIIDLPISPSLREPLAVTLREPFSSYTRSSDCTHCGVHHARPMDCPHYIAPVI